MLLVFLLERNNSHLNAAVHENNMDEEKQTTEITTQFNARISLSQ